MRRVTNGWIWQILVDSLQAKFKLSIELGHNPSIVDRLDGRPNKIVRAFPPSQERARRCLGRAVSGWAQEPSAPVLPVVDFACPSIPACSGCTLPVGQSSVNEVQKNGRLCCVALGLVKSPSTQ